MVITLVDAVETRVDVDILFPLAIVSITDSHRNQKPTLLIDRFLFLFHPPQPPMASLPKITTIVTQTTTLLFSSSAAHRRQNDQYYPFPSSKSIRRISFKSAEVSNVTVEGGFQPPSGAEASDDGKNWVPVVPVAALPRGERRVILQDGETILLLWYKDEIFAIENRSPAEGAYSEGLLNAKLTQDGCIVCPTTDSTYDLRTGAIKEWYPNNPVLRVLTPSLRSLFVYPIKVDEQNILISTGDGKSGGSAEIVFSGRAQPGFTASDVNVDEVRMVVDENVGGFGFTKDNELINGKAAIIGFLLLLDFELLTGKGLLKGTGILDFIYAASKAFSS